MINDCYNANPVSMMAALDHLAARARGRRRVAVLGDMAELGPGASRYHGDIGAAAGGAGVEVLVGLGQLARGYLEGGCSVVTRLWAPSVEEGVPALQAVIRPDDCVLVKGSRSMGLEVIADALAAATA